jgi:putative heme iron utilization protein
MADPAASSITAMNLELPQGAAPAFDAAGLAKSLLRATRAGTLATLDPGTGFPLATLVNVATDADGAPLLWVSGLSVHTRNLMADGRCSLLLAAAGKGDPLAHPRLTLVGQAARFDEPRAKTRFMAKHPKAQLYSQLPDFTMWRIEVTGVHLNGGFARAASLTPPDILTDISRSAPLVEAEAEAVAHMNEDHAAAVRAYATGLGKAKDGPWSLTGIDPDGMDLALGDQTLRIAFPRRVDGPGVLQKVLKEMAEAGRAAG